MHNDSLLVACLLLVPKAYAILLNILVVIACSGTLSVGMKTLHPGRPVQYVMLQEGLVKAASCRCARLLFFR